MKERSSVAGGRNALYNQNDGSGMVGKPSTWLQPKSIQKCIGGSATDTTMLLANQITTKIIENKFIACQWHDILVNGHMISC